MNSKNNSSELKRRVLVVAPEIHPFGGTERVTYEELIRFPKDWSITVLTSKVLFEKPAHIRFVCLPVLGGLGLLGYLSFYIISSFWVFLAQLLNRKFDIVFSPGINCLQVNVSLSHFARRFFDKKMLTFPTYDLLASFLTVYRFLYNAVIFVFEWFGYRFIVTKIACVSHLLSKKLSEYYGVSEKKIIVIHNGVDCAEFSPDAIRKIRPESRKKFGFSDHEKVILFIGNGLMTKGFPYLVKALESLNDSSVRLIAVTNDLTEPYKKYSWIRFLRPQRNVKEIYSLADILVHPSIFDSFGLPVLEAMACAIPVIVSRQAGVSELLTDGTDGIIIENPENEVEMIDKIRAILTNSGLAKQLSFAGRRKAEHLTWDKHAQALNHFLEPEFKAKN